MEIKTDTDTILRWVLDGYQIMDGGLSKRGEHTVRMTVLMGIDNAQDREIKDMLAFIGWSNEQGKSAGWIAGQLMHDLGGLAHIDVDSCFSPRTTGYSDIWSKK